MGNRARGSRVGTDVVMGGGFGSAMDEGCVWLRRKEKRGGSGEGGAE